MGEPDDVADVIMFLLSDASAWMTGQILTINGGSD
jgi:NAD(P)-dependent dehydrogenase (short-subunit alcohol dehydrogenase family)